MSTPNPNDPGYKHVDPDAPVVAPPRNSNALLWLLVLVALIALGLWWYGKREAGQAVDTSATAPQPAVVEETAPRPSVVADKKPVVKKPEAKPKPAAKLNRDPSPLASNQAPKYPPQALRSGVEGSVSVRVEVDANGNPTDVTVVERSGERSRDLDRAVTDAVRKWRFEPAMKDGKAVAGAVVVPVDFKSQ
jgi:protein TonB